MIEVQANGDTNIRQTDNIVHLPKIGQQTAKNDYFSRKFLGELRLTIVVGQIQKVKIL